MRPPCNSLTAHGRAQGGQGVCVGTLHGQGASSARGPLAQHLLPALGGCGEQGLGTAGATRPPLLHLPGCGGTSVGHMPAVPAKRVSGWDHL